VTLHEAPPDWLKEQAAKRARDAEAQAADDAEPDADLDGWSWVPHAEEGYLPAQYVRDGPGGTRIFQAMGSDEELKVRSDRDLEPILSTSSLRRHVDDMVKMESVNEPSVLLNVRLRFERQKIYTNIGEPRPGCRPRTTERAVGGMCVDAHRVFGVPCSGRSPRTLFALLRRRSPPL